MGLKLGKKIAVLIFVSLISACSATKEKKAALEAIADHRAQILSAELPAKIGSLSVNSAKARGTVINLLMSYNSESSHLPSSLIDNIVNYYCSNKEIKHHIEQGISYQIDIEDLTGHSIKNIYISKTSCA